MVERFNSAMKKIMRTAQTRQSAAELAAQIKALETIAATHLNGYFFRDEFTKLSSDLSFLQSVTHTNDDSGTWIATPEASLAESWTAQ